MQKQTRKTTSVKTLLPNKGNNHWKTQETSEWGEMFANGITGHLKGSFIQKYVSEVKSISRVQLFETHGL